MMRNGYQIQPRANLTDADLRGANLEDANLYGADLTGAKLTNAKLYCADLTGANLYGADLTGADLYCADLRGADLTGADLEGANLEDANLEGADLTDAKLRYAKLTNATMPYGWKDVVSSYSNPSEKADEIEAFNKTVAEHNDGVEEFNRIEFIRTTAQTLITMTDNENFNVLSPEDCWSEARKLWDAKPEDC